MELGAAWRVAQAYIRSFLFSFLFHLVGSLLAAEHFVQLPRVLATVNHEHCIGCDLLFVVSFFYLL